MAVSAPTQAPPLVPAPPAPAGTKRKRPLIYYGYWLVGVALVAQFVSAGTQTYVAGVFLGPMTDELGWSRTDFTSAQVVSRFVSAFAGFFVGVHVDKGRARGMMIVGCTILGAGLFLTSAVTEYWQWIILRGVMFTAGAALLSNLVVNVTLSKWWVDKRGRMVGISSMGVSLAGVILPTPLTWFVDEFGWRAGWQVLGVMAWLLIYPAAMMMRSTPEAHGLNPDGKSDEEMASARGANVRADFANSFTRSQALRTPALYFIVVAFGLSGVGLGTMLLHTIPFMTDAGISRQLAAALFGFLSVPAAFSKPIWGLLLDKVAAKMLAATSFLVAAAGMPVVIAGAASGSVPVLGAGLFLVGFGLGGQIPIQETIWASFFGRRYLGQVRSVAMPFSLFLGAGGPQVVSIYFDHVGNYNGAFIGVGALWVLAAGLVLFVPKPRHPNRGQGGPSEGGSTPPPIPVTPAPAFAAAVANGVPGAPPGNGALTPIGANGVKANGAGQPVGATWAWANGSGSAGNGSSVTHEVDAAASRRTRVRPRIPRRDYMDRG